MAGLSSDRLEQQGATGDGFTMMNRISQTDEQIPPVEHQRDTAGHQAAALEVARREATPAPLVLQFVKTVLAIGAIAIERVRSKVMHSRCGFFVTWLVSITAASLRFSSEFATVMVIDAKRNANFRGRLKNC